jgi:uncharacterized membrane protein
MIRQSGAKGSEADFPGTKVALCLCGEVDRNVKESPLKLKLRAIVTVCAMLSTIALAQMTNFSGNTRVLGKGSVISFDFPGAINTQATAITPSGDIVGRYTSADGIQHGFILSRGKFRPINFPGATSTDVTWINARGQIVGGYFNSVGNEHGFLLNGGKFTTLDFPDAQFTTALGIGATGDIVGVRGDSAGTPHGFLLRTGHFTSLDLPGATESLPAMISAGRIVGGYVNNAGLHGFSLTRGSVKTIDCPGSTFTFLSGLDPQGRVVGGYGTADGHGHGAIAFNGNCIPLDFPVGTNTYANGINPQGDIVGRYTGVDGIVHGFLLRGFVKTANVIYSAARDFSTRLNPNSVWSYGSTTSLGGAFTLYTISGTTFLSGEVGWFGPIPGCCAPGYPLVVAAPGVIPDVLDMGPGPSSYTVVRWTAPSRGRWDVVGEFSGTGLTTGDVHVLRNGAAILNSPLNGSDDAPFSLIIDVAPGDTIDFVAGPGADGNNDSDPTGFNVTITPEL